MKIKALRSFYDKVRQKKVLKGDIFEADKERAEDLIEHGYATKARKNAVSEAEDR